MTLQEINRSIISGTLSNEDLNSIGDAIKFARAQIAYKNSFALVKGCSVKFTNSRSGQTVNGTVEKVNRKFIIVKSGLTNWRVPANMLSAA